MKSSSIASSNSRSKSSSSKSSKVLRLSSSASNAETTAFFFLPFSCSSSHASKATSDPANSNKSILFARSYTSPSKPREARFSNASSISACVCSPRTNSPGSTYSNSSSSFVSSKPLSCFDSSGNISASVFSSGILSSTDCNVSSISSDTSCSGISFISGVSFASGCSSDTTGISFSSCTFSICFAASASCAAFSCAFNCSIDGSSTFSSSKSNSSKLRSSSLRASSASGIGTTFFCNSFACASFAISTADFVSLISCGSGLAACCAALANSTADKASPPDCAESFTGSLSISGSAIPAIPTLTESDAPSASKAIGVVESEAVFLEITSPINDSISSCVTAPPLWLISFLRFSKIVSLITPKSAFASSDKIISAFSCTTS